MSDAQLIGQVVGSTPRLTLVARVVQNTATAVWTSLLARFLREVALDTVKKKKKV